MYMSPHFCVFDNLDKHACNDLKPHMLKEREQLFMSLLQLSDSKMKNYLNSPKILI